MQFTSDVKVREEKRERVEGRRRIEVLYIP